MEKIILLSTPLKVYTQEQILLASLSKELGSLNFCKFVDSERINQAIKEINWNFLNPSFCDIRTEIPNVGILDDERYFTETLGRFVK